VLERQLAAPWRHASGATSHGAGSTAADELHDGTAGPGLDVLERQLAAPWSRSTGTGTAASARSAPLESLSYGSAGGWLDVFER
jgi:hypothetical protein